MTAAVQIAMIEADGQWRGIDANSDIGGRVRHVTSINDFEEADEKADKNEWI